jgi:hypothetical protein
MDQIVGLKGSKCCGRTCRRMNNDRPQLEGERPGLQSAGLEMGSSAGCCVAFHTRRDISRGPKRKSAYQEWLCLPELLFSYIHRCMRVT